jgi:hypothetical protein
MVVDRDKTPLPTWGKKKKKLNSETDLKQIKIGTFSFKMDPRYQSN